MELNFRGIVSRIQKRNGSLWFSASIIESVRGRMVAYLEHNLETVLKTMITVVVHSFSYFTILFCMHMNSQVLTTLKVIKK